MGKGVKAAVIGSVFAVMVGGAGYGAFNVMSALNGDGGSGGSEVKSGPPSGDEVKETSEKFFAAWEKGSADSAAQLTNNNAAARTLLTEYAEDAHITDVRITPGTAQNTTVPFTVRAEVDYKGDSKPLRYKSSLTVVRGLTTGKALIDWKPAVVHPELRTDQDNLVTGPSSAPPIEAVDRGGKVLAKDKYPSLGPILDALRAKYGEKAGGTPGVELFVRHDGDGTPDTPLLTLSEGRAGKLKTTISASAQAAAETAVKKYAESSVVAVKPTTGEVLAVANNRTDGWNAAFEGAAPPGSTMKIVTSAMLIDNGVTSMNGPAPCPDDAVWQGQTFRNLKNMAPNESATLANSFMRSCNTAFIKLIDEKPLTDESLTTEAQTRFGLGRDNWKTGITSVDGSIPAESGPDRAANAIGQGKVTMNPLNMASVTATAITGDFRQPYLVSPKLDGRKLATARGLPYDTASQLKQMMRLTATQGTAAPVMQGLGGDIGAKTGSAEVDGVETSNSWFTGFRDDVAAAAMSENGGHGVDAAGPIVKAVLAAGG
ncbi:penicillin-binding transpeptidase domain-containing protein [Streptomyces sp. WM6386]|uniref:penicillin-binding transpeptidase domain-containing protein n=1 Tax=Streptomyces sp. WM6386 TaxID=1415558 RepID=UPI000619F9DD|nr:penicillin-binding transpeptidase domain-containing protein [Streptomyces sp. WM6386]KKD04782.1 penicillin-binding protein [Streptomyces sp. WM6386]